MRSGPAGLCRSSEPRAFDPGTEQGRCILARAFVLFGGLLVLALLTALVAPHFVDWSDYRTNFERQAERVLGRDVEVRGPASARILPFPSLTFEDVTVSDDAGQRLLSVETFRMDAELAPLLSGELHVFSMTLEAPVLRVPIGADGSIGWWARRNDVLEGTTVVLEDVAVRDATVIVENAATGRTHEIADLDARFSADSLVGPMAGAGSALLDGGEAIDFTVSTGPLRPDGAVPLRLAVTSEDRDARIAIDGAAIAGRDSPGFTGRFAFASPISPDGEDGAGDEAVDPFAVLSGDSEPAPGPAASLANGAGGDEPPEHLTVRAEGDLEISPIAAKADGLRLQAGFGKGLYTMTGEGRIAFSPEPRFALDLEGGQVDFDAYGPAAEQRTGRTVGRETGDVGAGRRFEALRTLLARVPRPALDGTLSLSLPVVAAGDTLIREISLKASPEPTGWRIGAFSAELPGRTLVEANGALQLGDALEFDGDLLVASRQPSGLSDWLTGRVDPALRSLDRAGLQASVSLAAGRQRFSDMTLDIGGDRLTGRLSRVTDDARPRISTKLTGEAARLDALMAIGRLFGAGQTPAGNAAQYDVVFEAGPVTLDDVTADSVRADFIYAGDRVAIETLSIDGLAGASLEASGRLSDVVGDATGRLAVSLAAPQPRRILELLDTRLPEVPLLQALSERAGRLAPLALSGTLETREGEANTRPSLIVGLTGTANETAVTLDASIENGFAALSRSGRLGLDLHLENEAPTVLLGQLGVKAIDVGAQGPLVADLSLSTAQTGPVVATASLRAPDTELSLDGTFNVTPGGVADAQTSLYLRSDDMTPWLLTLARDVGQGFDSLPVNLGGSVRYTGGDWAVGDLSGALAGNQIEATLRRSAEAPVTGTVDVERLSLPWLAALVYGEAPDLSGEGEAWSRETFAAPRLPAVPFDIALSAATADLGGGVTADHFASRVAGDAQAVSLSQGSAIVAGSRVNGTVSLTNVGGVGRFSADLEAGPFAPPTIWPTLARTGTGAGEIEGNIALEATGQSYAALMDGLTGAGELTVRDTAIPGVPRDFFANVLPQADEQGFEPENDTAALFAGLPADEGFPVESVQARFSVSAGRLRLSPVTVSDGAERLTIDAQLALSDLSLGGAMTLAADAGDAAIEGASPDVQYALGGSLTAPEIEARTTPLANFLAARALEAEQARVAAMQARLEETLRLRRETRFYRWREQRIAEREQAQAQAAAEAAAAAAAEREARRILQQSRPVPDAGSAPRTADGERPPLPENPPPPVASGTDTGEQAARESTAPRREDDAQARSSGRTPDIFRDLPGADDPFEF